MKAYAFTLVLNRRPIEAELDSLFATGCGDAAFGEEQGLPVAEFNREAPTLADAIASAVREVEATGLLVLRALDDDLVTLADIGSRIGRSRESVRRYAAGMRGPGGFPVPVNADRGGTIFYRWSEVAPWIREHLEIEVSDSDPALVVANLVLQARQHRDKVEHMCALSNLLAA